MYTLIRIQNDEKKLTSWVCQLVRKLRTRGNPLSIMAGIVVVQPNGRHIWLLSGKVKSYEGNYRWLPTGSPALWYVRSRENRAQEKLMDINDLFDGIAEQGKASATGGIFFLPFRPPATLNPPPGHIDAQPTDRYRQTSKPSSFRSNSPASETSPYEYRRTKQT